MKNIIIRTDASLEIGSGHVMRCLTLANALRKQQRQIRFITRALAGHCNDLIQSQGFPIDVLDAPQNIKIEKFSSVHSLSQTLSHENWLGVSWQQDAAETSNVIKKHDVDWLIVDHYSLDSIWQTAVKPYYKNLMVIDDLADRNHICQLLLDQNFSNSLHKHYSHRTPKFCKHLLGTQYALIRENFLANRPDALQRRQGQLEKMLVFMGGSDNENDTSTVLHGLLLSIFKNLHIDVVLGKSCPHHESIRALCTQFPNARLHIQTDHMAELMRDADIAINAGGSITWERCVLGLPAIVVIQSKNQQAIAESLHKLGAHLTLGWAQNLSAQDYVDALSLIDREQLKKMSEISSALCDGLGADRVVRAILEQ
ncbi:MAG: UDP-2,4-diacetamido-2,4,6-trideoxy-beta-L-altropyranose hydrolase [Pseudomonadota bacterium]